MKLNRFKCLLQGVFNRTERVFNTKRNEYSHDDDVFANLRNGVDFSIHNEPEKVAYEYACKHLESIQSMIKKLPDEVPSEKIINEKFGDAINYLIIMEGLLKERIEK